VVTAYEREYRARILPALGPSRLGRLFRADIQIWIDSLAGESLAANTIRNAVTPLQALYAWAIPRGLAHVNPCTGLRLPSGEQARDRIATPAEAAALIAALPHGIRRRSGSRCTRACGWASCWRSRGRQSTSRAGRFA
jgi:site-specific recombinase XerD